MIGFMEHPSLRYYLWILFFVVGSGTGLEAQGQERSKAWVQKTLKRLDSDDPTERSRAQKQLVARVQRSKERYLPLLLIEIESRPPEVQRRIEDLFVDFFDPGVSCIEAAIKTSTGKSKAHLTSLVQRVRERRIVYVRRSVEDSLGYYETTNSISTSDRSYITLERLGSDAVPHLIAYLREKEQLEGMTSSAINPHLIKFADERIIGDLEDIVQTHGDVAEALAHIAGRRAIPSLMRALEEGDNTPHGIIKALGDLKAKEAVEPFCRRLKSETQWIKFWIIDSLVSIGEAEAVTTLKELWDDPEGFFASDERLRHEIADARCRLGDAEGLYNLISLVVAEETSLRDAKKMLSKLIQYTRVNLIKRRLDFSKDRIAIGEDYHQWLKQNESELLWNQREHRFHKEGEGRVSPFDLPGNKIVEEVLHHYLQSNSVSTFDREYRKLKKLGATAIPILMAHWGSSRFSEPDTYMGDAAIAYLITDLGGEEHIDELELIVLWKSQAGPPLAKIAGERALPALMTASSLLDDPRDIIRAIGHVGTPQAVDVLATLLIESSTQRRTIIESLVGIRNERVTEVLKGFIERFKDGAHEEPFNEWALYDASVYLAAKGNVEGLFGMVSFAEMCLGQEDPAVGVMPALRILKRRLGIGFLNRIREPSRRKLKAAVDQYKSWLQENANDLRWDAKKRRFERKEN